MVYLDGHPICGLKNQMKPEAQDRPKLFNLTLAKRTESG